MKDACAINRESARQVRLAEDSLQSRTSSSHLCSWTSPLAPSVTEHTRSLLGGPGSRSLTRYQKGLIIGASKRYQQHRLLNATGNNMLTAAFLLLCASLAQVLAIETIQAKGAKLFKSGGSQWFVKGDIAVCSPLDLR